jgi:hypothetical protein
MHVHTRRIAVSVLSFVGLAVFVAPTPALARVVSPLTLSGLAVNGAPVSFSASGLAAGSSARIVVIPGAAGLVAPAGTAAAPVLPCYSGTPIGFADVTADGSGNVAPTVVWPSAIPGTYQALLLQGSCASVLGGRTMAAATDQAIVTAAAFTIGESVPALSVWGLAALGLALAIAGGAFLSRSRA